MERVKCRISQLDRFSFLYIVFTLTIHKTPVYGNRGVSIVTVKIRDTAHLYDDAADTGAAMYARNAFHIITDTSII